MAARVESIETSVQISPCAEKLLGKDPQMQYALASFGHFLIIVKFSGGIAVYLPRYEQLKKLIFRESKLRSYISPFVVQSSPN